jgi:2-dehydro-3-deoxyphosphogluconate aldolase/(4S)-4-hydroxy-2-oxoglutarate aldolase
MDIENPARRKEKTLSEILKRKAIAVVRLKDAEKLMDVIKAVYSGGISVIEITMTVPNAIELIRKAANELDDDFIIGVGSVLNKKNAEDAIQAGAKYVVSPIFKKEIVDVAHNNDVPVIPGAYSPTEILTAQEYGADIVKVFPANVVGMDFFKAVLAPMPHLKIMPTGGVTLTNAGDWLKAGACAVGIGSALLDKSAIEKGNYDILTSNAKKIMDSIASAANGK